MKIYINEKENIVEQKIGIYKLRDDYYKNCEITILNGFPIKENVYLKEGDRISFIKKGKKPSIDEMENLLIARHTPNIHNKLKSGKVAILGLGGLGSNIAISLARIGVGELIIADYDIVEPSNLNRQSYFIEDIGEMKTKALKNHIKKINPYINVTTKDIYINEENFMEFRDAQIIIEAFDDPVSKAKLCNNVLTKLTDIYLIAASGMAGYYDSNMIETKKIKEKFYICGDFIHEAKIGEGLMAPRVAICANHMSNLAMRILIEDIK